MRLAEFLLQERDDFCGGHHLPRHRCLADSLARRVREPRAGSRSRETASGDYAFAGAASSLFFLAKASAFSGVSNSGGSCT